EILHYDALTPAGDQLGKLGAVDSCYYFATPKIFQRKSALYEPEKLRVFLRVYADGFFDLCTALAHGESGRVAVFYPSTAAIDQSGGANAEYVRRNPGKLPQRIHARHSRHLPPPAPNSDGSNRNNRRCQRRQRVGRDAA